MIGGFMCVVWQEAMLYFKDHPERSPIARRSSVQPQLQPIIARRVALAWWRCHVRELAMSPSLATRNEVPCKFARKWCSGCGLQSVKNWQDMGNESSNEARI